MTYSLYCHSGSNYLRCSKLYCHIIFGYFTNWDDRGSDTYVLMNALVHYCGFKTNCYLLHVFLCSVLKQCKLSEIGSERKLLIEQEIIEGVYERGLQT